MADETENTEQGGQTRTATMPTSTNNVTTRRLATAMQALWSKTDSAKADKITPGTAGNLAELDVNGNLADSGKSVDDFATAAQGALASTSVQSVKVGSSSGTELNQGGNVVLPMAIPQGTANATAGLISAADQMKLDEIEAQAQANQNAFSNVQVGQTKISASSSDPSNAGSTLTIASGTHISVTPNSADRSVTIASTLESKAAASGGTDVSLVTTGEKYTWNNPQNSISWDGTYNASTNKGATVSTVTDAIANLDVSDITANLGASKTLSALSETDGKISATAVSIQIAESQVTNLVSDLALKAPLASPALTGTPTAPTATTGTDTDQIATTAFVNAEIAAKMSESDAMIYKGPIAGGSTGDYGTLTPAADRGWTYKVSADGKIDGVTVRPGDLLVCNTDNTPAATSSTYSTVWANWDYYPGNTDGAVIGPDSATVNSVAGYSDTTGKVIKVLTADQVKSAAGLSSVVNTGDSDTPVSGGTTKFTTGGAYTELAKKADKTSTVTSVDWDSTNNKLTKTINGTTTDVVTASTLKSALDLSDKEDKSNKVTSWSGTVNDTHYPSEKLVKDSLDGKVDKESGKGLSTNDYTTAEKTKLAGIADGAEVNQNAYGSVKVGNTTVTASAEADTIEFVGDGATTVTASTANKSVTISSTDQKVKATAKTDNVNYKILATASASPTSGNTTEAVYDADITLNPSTNTIAANVSGNAATASAAQTGSALETAINGKASSTHTHKVKINGTVKTITAPGTAETDVTDLGTYLTSSDITGKADKVSSATLGNFAGLDSNGNLTDSGSKASDFATSAQGGKADTAIQGVKLDGASSALTPDSNKVVTIPDAVATGTTGATNGLMTAADKAKLNGIATGAEVNQNAFSNVKVGSTTIAADSKTDTLELVADGAVTLTPDSTNDKVTISATDRSVTDVGYHYAPAEDSSAEKDASGGSATQLPTSSSGTLVQVVTGVKMDAKGHVTGVVSKGLWSPDNNTTYTDPKLGFGYVQASSSTSGVYTATITDYTLNGGNGGMVGIKFMSDVPAGSTLNITGTGAKNIKYRGSNIAAGVIQNGDIAYFVYDGTSYILFAVDRSVAETTEQEIQDIIDSLT
jgi:hypothetical protein